MNIRSIFIALERNNCECTMMRLYGICLVVFFHHLSWMWIISLGTFIFWVDKNNSWSLMKHNSLIPVDKYRHREWRRLLLVIRASIFRINWLVCNFLIYSFYMSIWKWSAHIRLQSNDIYVELFVFFKSIFRYNHKTDA